MLVKKRNKYIFFSLHWMEPPIALNHAFVYFSIQNYTEDKRHSYLLRLGLHVAIPVMDMFLGVGAIFHNCSAIFLTFFSSFFFCR